MLLTTSRKTFDRALKLSKGHTSRTLGTKRNAVLVSKSVDGYNV